MFLMKTIFLTTVFSVIILSLSAQEIQLVEGDVQALKGIKSIATRVTYDSLLVGAEFPEATFIETKKKLWDEKEKGKGEAWEKHWSESKVTLYGPTFGYIFAKNSGIKVEKSAPYTLILKTRQIEPGWNGGPMGSRAFIIADLWIVDSSDESKVIAKFKLEKIKGIDKNGGDFEMGRRIQQAYTNAGKSLGVYFKGKIL
jgi:hypothetical protein